jgi:hypothetical protein
MTRSLTSPPRDRSPLNADPEGTNGGTRFAATVGTLTHCLVGEALAWQASGKGDPRVIILPRSQALAKSARVGMRTRACRIAIGTGAAVYLERFMLPDPWAFAGAEVELAPGAIADVVWSGPDGVVVDEIKTADGRVAGRASAARRDQVDRLTASGISAYGERFLGVRLIFVGASGHSVAYRVGRPPRPLAEDAELGPREVSAWR